MINSKYFFKGVACAKKIDSPAIALGVSFIAIGALLRNLGFTIQESIFSTFLTYALPGSLVMAESMLIGVSLLNIFLAVWLVNSRLYPMTESLMPLLIHKNQPRWKYYLSCHFVAVSSWLILKNSYEDIIIIDNIQLFYPDSLFLNTDHLNSYGSSLFTEKIISELKHNKNEKN